MNLNQFFWIFYKEFGVDESIPEYFIELIDCFIRFPSNNEERFLAGKDEFNPVQKTSSATIYTWVNKKGKATRNMKPKIAKAIYNLRDISKFADYFQKNATDQQFKAISNELRKFHFDANEDNCFDVSARILSKILEFRSEKKNDVKPEDIEEISFVQDTDIIFLQEVGNKCPLCNKKLIVTKHGKKLPQYRIMSIYPENIGKDIKYKLDAIKKAPIDMGADENKIPLCLTCANSYEMDPTLDDYKILVKIKAQALNTAQLDQNLQNANLEKQIRVIVKKISEFKDEDLKIYDVGMDPVTIKEKIPESLMLRLSVTNKVQFYYNIINQQFVDFSESSELDFSIVAFQFSIAYKKIHKFRHTREEQFQSMVSWMQQKLNLTDSYKTACETMIAFFIQNCEVFEKS